MASTSAPPGFAPPPGFQGFEAAPQYQVSTSSLSSLPLATPSPRPLSLPRPGKLTLYGIEQEPAAMSQEQLDSKSRKWQNQQARRFGSSRKTAFVDTGKQALPAEHLRKILKDHGDMSNR